MSKGLTGRRAAVAILTVATGIALAAAPAAAAAASATPAGAPQTCTSPSFHLNQFGTAMYGTGYRYCSPDPLEPVPVTVTVQRYNGATGTWQAVATGLGQAVYQCAGTATRTYRIAQRPAVTLTANCS